MRVSGKILLGGLVLMAQQPSPSQAMPPTFSQHTYGILNYDLFVPGPNDTSKKYPLITYFHGYSDTAKKFFNWYDTSAQSSHPCFVFAPKCPASDAQGWGNSWNDVFSTRLTLSFEVMDSLIKSFNIDTNRLYVYGTSMGGYGTFEVLYRYPLKFAAAMVLCGGGNPSTAAEVMQTPLWIFHGGQDNTVPLSQSQNLYNQMIALGATRVRFTEYPTAGHDMWNYAPHDPAWPDWIFNFSKGDTFSLRPNLPINISCTKMTSGPTSVSVTWNSVDHHQTRQNKIWYYKIFRNNSLLATLDFTKTQYSDVAPVHGLNVYTMTAVNYDFQESDSSNAASLDNTAGLQESRNPLPAGFALSQNYPNPFNPSTAISFTLPVEIFVSLKVFDLSGREVATLVYGELFAGTHTYHWIPGGLSGGIYFCRLTAGAFSDTRKLVLLK